MFVHGFYTGEPIWYKMLTCFNVLRNDISKFWKLIKNNLLHIYIGIEIKHWENLGAPSEEW